jgi:hypothetical protein
MDAFRRCAPRPPQPTTAALTASLRACRYHAGHNIPTDASHVWIGSLLYLVALRPVFLAGPPAGGPAGAAKVAALAVATLWPVAMHKWWPEVYLRWRDELFAVQ